MTNTYRDKIDVGGLAIQISIVAEDGGPHVEVWPEFDDDGIYPPGVKDAINDWCNTRQAQDWAIRREQASRKSEHGSLTAGK